MVTPWNRVVATMAIVRNLPIHRNVCPVSALSICFGGATWESRYEVGWDKLAKFDRRDKKVKVEPSRNDETTN